MNGRSAEKNALLTTRAIHSNHRQDTGELERGMVAFQLFMQQPGKRNPPKSSRRSCRVYVTYKYFTGLEALTDIASLL